MAQQEKSLAVCLEIRSLSVIFKKAYHYSRVEFTIIIYTHDSCIESTVITFRLMDYFHSLVLWCTCYGTRGQHCIQYVSDVLLITSWQLAAYFGTGLENIPLIGMEHINITVLIHPYMLRHTAKVIANQIHNGSMFDSFFFIAHLLITSYKKRRMVKSAS